jgi:uncharacterized protein with PIN domain
MIRKRKRCKQCNSKMKKVGSVIDTRTPLDRMYGFIRIFSDVYTIDRVNYFYQCKKCNKIYRDG